LRIDLSWFGRRALCAGLGGRRSGHDCPPPLLPPLRNPLVTLISHYITPWCGDQGGITGGTDTLAGRPRSGQNPVGRVREEVPHWLRLG